MAKKDIIDLNHKVYYHDSMPIAGRYIIGDEVINSKPSVGSPKSWICVTKGTASTEWEPTTVYHLNDTLTNDGFTYKALNVGFTHNDKPEMPKEIGAIFTIRHDAPDWKPNTQYNNGDFVISPSKPGFGLYCLTGGTSGSIEPTWNTGHMAQTVDGAVIWECRPEIEFENIDITAEFEEFGVIGKSESKMVTKEDIGLGNVDNVKQATKEEFDEFKDHVNSKINFNDGIEIGDYLITVNETTGELKTTLLKSINQGLVLHYDFRGKSNEDSDRDIVNDLSGNNNNANLINFSFTDTNGYYDDALLFNMGFIDAGNILNMGLKGMTHSLWIKTNSSGDITAISKAASGSYNLYSTGIYNGNPYIFMRNDVGGTIDFSINSYVTDDTWRLLTFTFDRNGNASIYVNGVLIASEDISAWATNDIQSNTPFRIGAYSTSDNIGTISRYYGYIRDVKVYDRALTQEEVSHNYFVEKRLYKI